MTVPTNTSSPDRCPIKNRVKYVPVIDPNMIKEKQTELLSVVKIGGAFQPKCIPIQSVAIIVPYRNRSMQLEIFNYNLHKLLIMQNIVKYQLFVLEQKDRNQFNRAKLFNIGFEEALKIDSSFDCFIFHDVELIPMNYENLYLCFNQPRHMSYKILLFKLFYPHLFGGACSILKKQFYDVNGFSNLFYGWGGEDDEMRSRLIRKKYSIERLPREISMYLKLYHGKDLLNDPNPSRYQLIRKSYLVSHLDGINSLSYNLISISKYPLYTLITVDLTQ